MLDFFYKLAIAVRPWRFALLGLLAAFVVMSGYGLLQSSSAPSAYLTVGLSGILWSGLLIATAQLFQHVPPRPTTTLGFFSRWKIKCQRGLFYLLAILFLFSSLMLLNTCYRLFSV